MTALLVSNLALWVVVIALALALVALARQVGVLHERVGPAGALSLRGGPEVGSAAPALEVETLGGLRLSLGGAHAAGRSTLLVFVSPSCPVCRQLAPTLRAVRRREQAWLELVLASDGDTPEIHRAYRATVGLEEVPYVLSSALGLAYQVGKLPHAVLLDESGVLRAKGLVNSREHLESLFEAKERGVGSIQEYFERHGAA